MRQPVLLGRAAVFALYATTWALLPLARAAGWILRRGRGARPTPRLDVTVLVIGTFYARNWCVAHLLPLSRATNVRAVLAVVDGPTQPLPRVRYIQPPRLITRLFGRMAGRVWACVRIALVERPDVVMGYHLVPNGLLALLVGGLCGARTAYQLTGGPVELIGGGHGCENRWLCRLRTPSRRLERLARALARRFDLLVVRGRQAERYALELRPRGLVRIVPAGLAVQRFAGGGERDLDIVFVGRLTEIKQPELALAAIAELRRRGTDIRGAFVGDGPLRAALERAAGTLGIANRVCFAGHVDDVDALLRRARVFLLTSRTEGLSIALAEAMAAGCVPVVADVGELGDLVRDGETGYRITSSNPTAYADRIAAVLRDPAEWTRLSRAAQSAAATHNGLDAIAQRWTRTLEDARSSEIAHTLQRPRASFGAGQRRKLWQNCPPATRRVIAPFTRTVPPAYWFGGSFRRRLALARAAERWSAEQLRAYQLAQVQRICRIAYERSPFWRTRFDDAGLHPAALRTLDDLQALPTIDANTIRAHPESLPTVAPDAPHAEYVSTGGTGGRPLAFLIDRDRSATEYAHLVQSWRRVGYELDIPQAVFRGEIVPLNRDGLRHKYDPLLRRHFYSNFHMTDADIAAYLAHLRTVGPCYLHVYPSSAAALARCLHRRQEPAPKNLLGILAGSENVYPEDRDFVERAFGVRCYSWYGHSEKAVLAAECEHSRDYHVWPTYGYFELLDDAGRPITVPGQRGEIVGTSFINTVMPFIRYRTGDFATFVGDRCTECGRAHPVIRDIRGHRTHELLVAADGSQISWTALNMHDDTFAQLAQFQFRQEQPGRAELLIVPGAGFGTESQARMEKKLARKLGDRLAVTVRIVDHIPVSPRGKVHYVDQRVNLNAPPAAALERV